MADNKPEASAIFKQKLFKKLDALRRVLDTTARARTQTPTDTFMNDVEFCPSEDVSDLTSHGYAKNVVPRITDGKRVKIKQKLINMYNNMKNDKSQPDWYSKSSEAIGLFYAAYMTVGMSIGAFIGFRTDSTLLSAGIGVAWGLGIGICLGVVTHGTVTFLNRNKDNR